MGQALLKWMEETFISNVYVYRILDESHLKKIFSFISSFANYNCVEMSNTEIKVNFVPFTPQIQLFQYNNFTWLSQDKIEVKSVG